MKFIENSYFLSSTLDNRDCDAMRCGGDLLHHGGELPLVDEDLRPGCVAHHPRAGLPVVLHLAQACLESEQALNFAPMAL